MATTIHDILKELFDASTDERDKGDRFERLMAAYLRTDPTWTDRFTNVWLWMDWPGRQGKPDTGIDLVAEERDGGGLTAIQCKFYVPTHTLQRSDIDSFFTASGKAGFSSRLIVSTTDRWSRHAEEALSGQQIPVTRLRVQDLGESSIDWSQFSLRTPEVMALKDKKVLRKHQTEALENVSAGLTSADRGKLIMACGTGKTFTALRIAEHLVAPGGSVLFLVPSISLLSQTLKEWTAEAEVPLRPFAVCSDTKVGKRSDNEDISPYDLAFPASTDPTKLHQRVAMGDGATKITVVFSTYQSLPVVAAAQDLGLPAFNLVVCDEAHRTTGVTLAGEDESNFVRVHDQTFIEADKRLYMTATPRIYDDSSKSQAVEGAAVLASMDDEALYGRELHRLGFGEAVSHGLLTDYKVLVLAVDEQAVSTTFQAQLADRNSELGIDDAAKIVGCWNGLAKRGRAGSEFGEDPRPMERAVAFSRSIKDSKRFAGLFTEIVDQYLDAQEPTQDDGIEPEPLLRCEADHVDGTFNMLQRNQRLDWLKAPLEPHHCRVLSNAKCLSEGVDVPALDAVMFLNPRNSVVDVVQSVGRVMRLAPGKEYGYVILPIGIPADTTPEQALANNEKYKVVWQVLQALRAHDERFNAMINQIELNKANSDKLQIIGVSGWDTETPGDAAKPVQEAFAFPQIGEWRDAIYAKIVKKVGDRRYWEDWAKDVSIIAERHSTRINSLLLDPDLDVADSFDRFLEGLRCNLNDGITRDDAIDMLAQHLITKPVFDALFEDYSFAEHNPVSRVMEDMLAALDDQNLEREQQGLDKFYESVRVRAEGIDNAEGKQRIITELYEKFFKIAFPRTADKLGIVYTPTEVVDWLLRSVEQVLQREFGASLSDEGVHVLDPFTGTGTFIARLLQSDLIRPEDLLRKYTSELHANEILLLAYYIAAINIEATFHGLAGGEYVPFDGIVLTDTFQMAEAGDAMDEIVFPQNNARVAHQQSLDIRVIVGNPPYSAGQTSGNDGNANQKYPTLDGKIAATYAARSTATNKNSLYDSYIRAIRWASDRIATSAHGGVVAFVTNGGYLDSNTADGLRKTLADEFHALYFFNLRGNQRTAGELSRREGGKVFGAGSRSTVAMMLLVKKPGASPGAVLHYRDIGDYLSREEKLQIVGNSALDTVTWETILPNTDGDWLHQRDEWFVAFTPIGGKDDSAPAVFRTYSGGLKTNRDAWVYNFSERALQNNVQRMISTFNSETVAFAHDCAAQGVARHVELLDKFIDLDPTTISWSGGLKALALRGKTLTEHSLAYRLACYRPFAKQWVYFDSDLNERRYQLDRAFPTTQHCNVGFYITGMGSDKPFSVLATDVVPDLAFWGSSNGQYFPRYTYAPSSDAGATLFGDEAEDDVPAGWIRTDNITDVILADYRMSYGASVSKDDVFHYVYGLLHAPDYRVRFAADLKRMLPRIPKVTDPKDFRAFVDAGARLTALHVGYESVTPYPLEENTTGPDLPEHWRVRKMVFGKRGKDKDRSTVIVNSSLTLTGIPDEAYEYQLGARSAIEWVMERYQVKTDKASGILNNPNDWADELGDPRYIVDLVKRIVTVSIETARIVKTLPALLEAS